MEQKEQQRANAADDNGFYHDSFVDQIDSLISRQKLLAAQLHKEYLFQYVQQYHKKNFTDLHGRSKYKKLSQPKLNQTTSTYRLKYKPDIDIGGLLRPLEKKWKVELSSKYKNHTLSSHQIILHSNTKLASNVDNLKQTNPLALESSKQLSSSSPLDQRILELKQQIRASMNSINSISTGPAQVTQEKITKKNKVHSGGSVLKNSQPKVFQSAKTKPVITVTSVEDEPIKPETMKNEQPQKSGFFAIMYSAPALEKNEVSNIDEPVPVAPSKPIVQRRFEEYLKEKEERLNQILDFRFHAKPVPKSSLVLKLEKIKRAQAERRQKTIESRLEELKKCEKPFNFREKQTSSLIKVKKSSNLSSFLSQTDSKALKRIRFKARDIPIKIRLLRNSASQKTEEQQIARRKKLIQQRAAKLLAESSLPSRMAIFGKHDRKLKDPVAKQCTFAPKVNLFVPDFKKLQQTFEKQLKIKKEKLRAMLLTRHANNARRRNFAVSISSRQQNTKRQLNDKQGTIGDHALSNRKIDSTTPKKDWSQTAAKETRSFQLKKLYAEQSLKEMRDQDAQIKAELEQKNERRRLLSAKIRNALHVDIQNYEKRKAEIQNKWKEVKNTSGKEYREELRQMLENLDARPCIFERVTAEEAAKHAKTVVDRTMKQHGM